MLPVTCYITSIKSQPSHTVSPSLESRPEPCCDPGALALRSRRGMKATPRSKQIAEDLEGRTSAATPRTQAARVERARKGGDEKRPINPGMGSLEEGSIGADDRTESGMHVDYPTPRVSEASDATREWPPAAATRTPSSEMTSQRSVWRRK